MFAVALALSVAGLLVGPALAAWARGRSLAVAALDGATLGVVPALLLARLLPHLVGEIGTVALVAMAGGYGGFLLIESRGHDRAASLGLALVVPTLAVHSFLDGAALAVAYARGSASVGSATLGAALVIHKVPEGLFLASRFGPSVGTRGAFARVGALGATTVLGALSGRELLAHTPDNTLHVVVAVGLGVMLRMVIHRHDEPDAGTRERTASGAAFLACLILVAVMPSPVNILDRSQPHELSVVHALVPLFLESAPWLLVVLGISEVAHWAVPAEPPDADEKPSAWFAATALTLVLLGPMLACVRAAVDPILRGVAMSRRPFAGRLRDLAPRANVVLPSYAAGVVLSIVAEAALPRGILSAPSLLAIPVAIAAAQLIPLGPTGASVVAALLVHKGAPPSAGLAFMLGSVATTSTRTSWTRCGIVLSLVWGVAALVSVVLPSSASVSLHDLGAHRHRAYEWIAAASLVWWTVIELVRQGPRAWFRAAFSHTTPGVVPSSVIGGAAVGIE